MAIVTLAAPLDSSVVWGEMGPKAKKKFAEVRWICMNFCGDHVETIDSMVDFLVDDLSGINGFETQLPGMMRGHLVSIMAFNTGVSQKLGGPQKRSVGS